MVAIVAHRRVCENSAHTFSMVTPVACCSHLQRCHCWMGHRRGQIVGLQLFCNIVTSPGIIQNCPGVRSSWFHSAGYNYLLHHYTDFFPGNPTRFIMSSIRHCSSIFGHKFKWHCCCIIVLYPIVMQLICTYITAILWHLCTYPLLCISSIYVYSVQQDCMYHTACRSKSYYCVYIIVVIIVLGLLTSVCVCDYCMICN